MDRLTLKVYASWLALFGTLHMLEVYLHPLSLCNRRKVDQMHVTRILHQSTFGSSKKKVLTGSHEWPFRSVVHMLCLQCAFRSQLSCSKSDSPRPLPFSEIFWKRPAVRLDAVEQKIWQNLAAMPIITGITNWELLSHEWSRIVYPYGLSSRWRRYAQVFHRISETGTLIGQRQSESIIIRGGLFTS